MFCVSWHGPGGYDRFICVDESEMQVIVNHYDDPEAAAWGRSGHYYYLLCDEKRILTPLKRPALAFGGMWNGYPPYGDETTTCYFALDRLSEYRLEKDWSAPKE